MLSLSFHKYVYVYRHYIFVRRRHRHTFTSQPYKKGRIETINMATSESECKWERGRESDEVNLVDKLLSAKYSMYRNHNRGGQGHH